MPDCDHEEADSRICVHVSDALHKGAHDVLVRTVDTDVVVILVGSFFHLKTTYPDMNLWVGFGTGKHYRYYDINSMCQQLGVPNSTALPFYHAFTGCDTTSQFFGKGKKTSWDSWKAYPEVTEAFLSISDHPFQSLQLNSHLFELLERYTCILYDKTTSICSVNELRQELFCKRSKMMENIPPTQVIKYIPVNLLLLVISFFLCCKFYRLHFCNMQIGLSIRPVSGLPVSKCSKMFHHQKDMAG